jgi:hypothetical protein
MRAAIGWLILILLFCWAMATQLPQQPRPMDGFRLTTLGEHGSLAPETMRKCVRDSNNSLSYGRLGLNSMTGSAEQFARDHPDLGLTARPGTAEFNQQWEAAATNNPFTLDQTERDWYEIHAVAPARQALSTFKDNISRDPRVLAYMADRFDQMSTKGLQRTLDAARSAKTPEEFIRAVSDNDRANIVNDFPNALKGGVANAEGLLRRIRLRETNGESESDASRAAEEPTPPSAAGAQPGL